VVAVLVYHLPWSGAPGGFLGVDVFFVLSGYLITGLLLDEHERRGRIDLRRFYLRRARRLLPALLLVTAFVVLVAPRVLDAPARGALRLDAVAGLLYVTNWRFVAQGQSYFASFGDPTPFQHLWSLAIEEQFYLFLPLLLLGLVRVTRGRRRPVAAAFAVLAALSAVVCALVFDPQSASRAYYGTDSRVQELFVGSALAVVLPLAAGALRRRGRLLEALGWGSAAVVLWCLHSVTDGSPNPYRGGFLAFCAVVAVVLATIEVRPAGSLARTLGSRPMRWIGEISYGVYLWHWPIFVLTSPRHLTVDAVARTLLRVTLTFLVAWLSHRLLERPIRDGALGRLWGSRRAVLAGALAPVLVLVAAVLLTPAPSSGGLPTARAGEQVDAGDGLDRSADRRIMLVGDSVAFALGYHFPRGDFPGSDASGPVRVGCGTAVQWLVVNGERQSTENAGCRDQFASWRTERRSLDPTVVVWLLGAWDVYDHWVDGAVLPATSQAYRDHLGRRLDEGLAALGGDVPVVVPLVPCYAEPEGTVVEGQDMAADRNDPARAASVNEAIRAFAARHPERVHVVDTASWLCPGGRARTTDEAGRALREDGVHYTSDGVRAFWHWLMPQLAAVTPAR
jgi:peptidoglycan/LPS O-acetylase OafA/YrhL